MGCPAFRAKDMHNGFVLVYLKEYPIGADSPAPQVFFSFYLLYITLVWIKRRALYNKEDPFRISFGEAAERFIDRCVNLNAPVFA